MSHETVDLLYLCYNSAYGHQTWQDDDPLWEVSTYKVTQSFEEVIKWDQEKNLKHLLYHNVYGHQTWQGC